VRARRDHTSTQKEEKTMQHDGEQGQQVANKQEATPSGSSGKPWRKPKLAFIEPKLTRHGKLEAVSGAFGSFDPTPPQ